MHLFLEIFGIGWRYRPNKSPTKENSKFSNTVWQWVCVEWGTSKSTQQTTQPSKCRASKMTDTIEQQIENCERLIEVYSEYETDIAKAIVTRLSSDLKRFKRERDNNSQRTSNANNDCQGSRRTDEVCAADDSEMAQSKQATALED